jgi:hypothetical protein
MHPIRRSRAALYSVMLVWVFLSACGGEQGGAPPPAAPPAASEPAQPAETALDACALIPKAEVEAVAGRPVLDGQSENIANLSTCGWADPTAPAAGVIPRVAQLAVLTGSGAAAAKGAYDISHSNAAETTPVNGLGDGAFWDGINRYLHTYKGRHQVSIYVDGNAGLDVARGLAEKALSRLP